MAGRGCSIPSLIRSIEDTFDQNDAGIGLIYLLYSVAYAAGSFGGGPATERLGRRTVLTGAALLHGAGIIGLGLAPSWAAFMVLALPAGLGAGALDGGSNGLFLDLFRTGRGRAMNLLHLFFSVGALSAPLIVGGARRGRDTMAGGDGRLRARTARGRGRLLARVDAEWTGASPVGR